MVNGNNERLTSNDHYYMARSRLYSHGQNNLWSTRKTWKTFGVDAAQNETTDGCRFKASKLPSGIEPNGSTNRKHCGKARSHIQKMQVLKPSEPPSFHVYPLMIFTEKNSSADQRVVPLADRDLRSGDVWKKTYGGIQIYNLCSAQISKFQQKNIFLNVEMDTFKKLRYTWYLKLSRYFLTINERCSSLIDAICKQYTRIGELLQIGEIYSSKILIYIKDPLDFDSNSSFSLWWHRQRGRYTSSSIARMLRKFVDFMSFKGLKIQQIYNYQSKWCHVPQDLGSYSPSRASSSQDLLAVPASSSQDPLPTRRPGE